MQSIKELYKIGKMYMVDTPGFSALDINILDVNKLQETFKEFKKYSCMYKDCTHNNESGCGVKKAVENGLILKSRYDNYINLLKVVYENSSKLYK